MPTDTSNETNHEERTKERRRSLSSAGLHLANVLWGIERFGRPSAEEPPPIHITFAWQLQTSRELREHLRAALNAMED